LLDGGHTINSDTNRDELRSQVAKQFVKLVTPGRIDVKSFLLSLTPGNFLQPGERREPLISNKNSRFKRLLALSPGGGFLASTRLTSSSSIKKPSMSQVFDNAFTFLL